MRNRFSINEKITNKGKVRKANEDSVFLGWWKGKSAVLAVVADGMGGHKGGKEASQTAIDVFKHLLDNPLPLEKKERYDLLLEAFYDANLKIREKSDTDFNLAGMGTTLVAAIITPKELLHLYAGDCRLYHFNQETPYVTLDHSVVSVLLNLGQITKEQIPTHPMRSVVTSCLGGKSGNQFTVEPKWNEEQNNSSAFRELNPGDIILLSSDGFHSQVEDDVPANLVNNCKSDMKLLTNECCNAAMDAGGNDNISVIAIAIKERNRKRKENPNKILDGISDNDKEDN